MKNKKNRKAVTILTVISVIVTIINVSYNFILPIYLTRKLDLGGASSIGIIGGADGPTSILVSNAQSIYIITVISALLSIAGTVYLIIDKRNN